MKKKVMRSAKIITLLGLFVFLNSVKAQTNLPKDSTNNLLDMQASTYSNILGEGLTGVPGGNVKGYLDLLDKIDLPEKQKVQLRAFYETYAAQLDEKGKDSLEAALSKKLLLTKKKDTL